jgi:hypothetical protein
MTDTTLFTGMSFPSRIECVFNEVISIGWYDGTASGLALNSLHSMAFRFDLIDWGPCQEIRIFALSPLPARAFEQAVELLKRLETPKWPIWHPPWPKADHEQKILGRELDAILAQANSPEFAFASESRFSTILAAKSLTEPGRTSLPTKFDGQPNGGFDYWQKYLELTR